MLVAAALTLVLLAPAGDAEAHAPYVLDVDATLLFTARAHEPQSDLRFDETTHLWRFDAVGRPVAGRSYPSTIVSVDFAVEPTPGLLLHASLITGEVRPGSSLEPPISSTVSASGVPVGDWLSSGAFVRELAVSYAGSRGSVEVGRSYTRLFDGLVYEDSGTGASGALHLGRSVDLEGSLLVVGHTFDELSNPSPLGSLRLRWEFAPFQSVELAGAWFDDRSGVLWDQLQSILVERTATYVYPGLAQLGTTIVFDDRRTSTGDLRYFGGTVNLLPADGLSVRAAAVGAVGRLEKVGKAATNVYDLSGWAATLDTSLGLGPHSGVGLTLVAMSGDDPPLYDRGATHPYRGFIAVAPFWTWTSMFFSGGLSQGLYPGRASAAGVNGHGVQAAIARADYRSDRMSATLKVASLRSPTSGAGAPVGGNGYFLGVEADGLLEVHLSKATVVGAELDLFRPGNFFPTSTLAYRALALVRLHAGN